MRFTLSVVFAAVILAVLLSLGVWQLRRMVWKEAVLADLETRISAPPATLPARPEPGRDQYLPVRVSGWLSGEGVRVLASSRATGAGYRMLQVLITENGRRVLADLGIQPVQSHAAPFAQGPIAITGNLHWPQETDGWTPEPEPEKGLYFARDVSLIAGALGTEPVLVVARVTVPPLAGIRPLPVSTAAIPNRHLEYVFTWFAFAFIWSLIAAVMLRRIWRARAGPQEGS